MYSFLFLFFYLGFSFLFSATPSPFEQSEKQEDARRSIVAIINNSCFDDLFKIELIDKVLEKFESENKSSLPLTACYEYANSPLGACKNTNLALHLIEKGASLFEGYAFVPLSLVKDLKLDDAEIEKSIKAIIHHALLKTLPLVEREKYFQDKKVVQIVNFKFKEVYNALLSNREIEISLPQLTVYENKVVVSDATKSLKLSLNTIKEIELLSLLLKAAEVKDNKSVIEKIICQVLFFQWNKNRDNSSLIEEVLLKNISKPLQEKFSFYFEKGNGNPTSDLLKEIYDKYVEQEIFALDTNKLLSDMKTSMYLPKLAIEMIKKGDHLNLKNLLEWAHEIPHCLKFVLYRKIEDGKMSALVPFEQENLNEQCCSLIIQYMRKALPNYEEYEKIAECVLKKENITDEIFTNFAAINPYAFCYKLEKLDVEILSKKLKFIWNFFGEEVFCNRLELIFDKNWDKYFLNHSVKGERSKKEGFLAVLDIYKQVSDLLKNNEARRLDLLFGSEHSFRRFTSTLLDFCIRMGRTVKVEEGDLDAFRKVLESMKSDESKKIKRVAISKYLNEGIPESDTPLERLLIAHCDPLYISKDSYLGREGNTLLHRYAKKNPKLFLYMKGFSSDPSPKNDKNHTPEKILNAHRMDKLELPIAGLATFLFIAGVFAGVSWKEKYSFDISKKEAEKKIKGESMSLREKLACLFSGKEKLFYGGICVGNFCAAFFVWRNWLKSSEARIFV